MRKYKVVISIVLITLMMVTGLPVAAITFPGNDNFADAYTISGESGSTTGHNVGATIEVGEPAWDSTNTVWWSWTAPTSDSYVFDTLGSDFDTYLQIYTGSDVDALTEEVYNDDFFDFLQSGLILETTAGTTYMICVRGYNDDCFGNISLNWCKWNDDFANAAIINGESGTATGFNEWATNEEGDPLSDFSGSIWWSWTAPQSGYVEFSIESNSTDFVLGICTGTNLGSLSLIGFGDDYSESRDTRAIAKVTEGTTYSIAVSSYSSGNYMVMNWEYIDAANIPANDDFANAYVLEGANGTSSSNNVYATREIGEPEHLYLSFSSVWWSWTAPSDDTFFWDTEGCVPLDSLYGNDYVNISIYTGNSVDDLTLVVQGNKGQAVTLDAVAGRTYRIAVDSDFSSFWSIGDIALNWAVLQDIAFTSADHATFMVGSSGSFDVAADGYPVPSVFKYSGILPSGVEFVGGKGLGVLSGTPAPGSAGTYSIIFEAWNSFGRIQQNFTLIVAEAPAITSSSSVSFETGAYGSFKVAATGYPVPTVKMTGDLPSGVSFNESTTTLSGTPDYGTAGTYELTFTADNGVSTPYVQNFTLTVLDRYAPLITLQPDDTAVLIGESATFTVEYSASPDAHIQWQYSTDGVRWRDLTGANTATYTTPATKRNMDGYQYRAVLSNYLAAVMTEPAMLSVMSAPFTTVDLEITQEEGDYNAANQQISWVIRVSNLGLESAADVKVTDILARGTKFAGITGLESISGASYKVSGSTLNISLGEIAAGDSVAFTISAQVTRAVSPIENTASVATASYDSDLANNTSQATCTF